MSALTELFTAIANAIRTKKGTSESIYAEDFADEITNLPTGIDTSDATATTDDILINKTAYVNGQKLTGTLPKYVNAESTGSVLGKSSWAVIGSVSGKRYNKYYVADNIGISLRFTEIANTVGLTAEKLKKDEEVMGVVGTYEGSATTPEENAVNFYDYEGTLLYSYTKAEFLALSEMPENPTHEGLTAQGWNWTLSDAKNHLNTYDTLDIGQSYITSDEKTHIHIEIISDAVNDVRIHFEQSSANGVEIDWGDGSSIETVENLKVHKSHNYASTGNYEITLNPIGNCTILFGGNNGDYTLMSMANVNESVYSSMLRKIYIGKNVNEIYINSFRFCYGLEEVTIPIAITNFWSNSFYNCRRLKFIVIPKNVLTMGQYMLAYCSELKKVIIPKSITSIGAYAFEYCTSLQSIILNESINIINKYLFYACYSLTDIVIPNTVQSIDDYAFEYCYGLQKVKLSSALLRIGQYGFGYCLQLSEIELPDNFVNLDLYGLSYCYALPKIKIPVGVTTIKQNVFNSCYGVGIFDFTDFTSVPTLQSDNAFSGIKVMNKIVVPDNLYSTWKSTGNWVYVANFIHSESEV